MIHSKKSVAWEYFWLIIDYSYSFSFRNCDSIVYTKTSQCQTLPPKHYWAERDLWIQLIALYCTCSPQIKSEYKKGKWKSVSFPHSNGKSIEAEWNKLWHFITCVTSHLFYGNNFSFIRFFKTPFKIFCHMCHGNKLN